jgi:hypothetical protein
MARQNPFADDVVKGEVWEQGYLAGFNDPDVDHSPGPLTLELLDVYHLGEQSGRDDQNGGPANGGGAVWVAPDFDFGELPEHLAIHRFGVVMEKIGVAAGGLISLVITALSIPGDTSLHPLDPESGSLALDKEGRDGNTYVAICPHSDHPMVQQGVTRDGYWTGPGRSLFVDAVADMRSHDHAEAFVVRCSLPEGTCGPVWAIQ